MARKVKGRNGGTLYALEKGETANPKGRPPKIATTVIKALKDQGIARVDRTEVDELIARLQNMPRKKLMVLAKDEENTPMVVMLIARGMLGKAGHEFLVRDLWDRAHGRPKQEVKVEESGEVKHTIKFTRG